MANSRRDKTIGTAIVAAIVIASILSILASVAEAKKNKSEGWRKADVPLIVAAGVTTLLTFIGIQILIDSNKR